MALLLKIIGVFIGVAASAVTFRVPMNAVIWTGFAGLLGYEVQYALSIFNFGSLASTAIGALTISLTGELLARSRKMPASVFVVPGILPLVPGTLTYHSMLALISTDLTTATKDSIITALLIAGSISIGMLLGSSIARAWINPHPPAKHPKILGSTHSTVKATGHHSSSRGRTRPAGLTAKKRPVRMQHVN